MSNWFTGRWLWLSCIHQWWLRWRRLYIRELPKILIARYRYPLRLKNVRAVVAERKLTVLFPISNLAKWKMQSVFDAMKASKVFEPIIFLTAMDTECALSVDSLKSHLENVRTKLCSRQMRVMMGYDFGKNSYVPICDFGPDIVFYQQPYGIDVSQDPYAASRVALTCYVPYFVQNYGGLDMDCDLFFHRLLWRHFTLSESWARIFERYQGGIRRAGHVVGLGHPMLDCFADVGTLSDATGAVIYAPHWSCGNVGERYSTFLENGEQMLVLAKKHPEIKWIFKPHPTLRQTLLKYGFMTPERVASYFAEWEKIAVSCYDGSYVELFEKSSAMITDCGSFLVEYACTGKPIIHLVAKNPEYQPHPISAKLFNTYYQAHNWEEFERNFDVVVLQKRDPMRDVRTDALNELNLTARDAGKRIVSYLEAEVGRVGK